MLAGFVVTITKYAAFNAAELCLDILLLFNLRACSYRICGSFPYNRIIEYCSYRLGNCNKICKNILTRLFAKFQTCSQIFHYVIKILLYIFTSFFQTYTLKKNLLKSLVCYLSNLNCKIENLSFLWNAIKKRRYYLCVIIEWNWSVSRFRNWLEIIIWARNHA